MPTKEQLLEIYRQHDNEKLYELYAEIDEYTEEAKEALLEAINDAGGIDHIKTELVSKIKFQRERERVFMLARDQFIRGADYERVQEKVKSEILSEKELESALRDAQSENNIRVKDQRIKPRTILGGIIGGFIGGTISGALLAYYLTGANKIMILLVVGLALNCYFFVWLFTRQSYKNAMVLLISICSIAYAFICSGMFMRFFDGI